MTPVKRILLVLFLALTATTVLAYVPTPYVLRAPGRAQDVASMIRIADHPAPARPGKLLITTVIYEPATALYCIYALFDSKAELLPQGRRQTAAAAEDPQEEQMDRSQYMAKVAALLYLGYELRPQARGAGVMGLLAGSPAQGVLAPGDVIVEANGRSIRHAEDLTEVVSAASADTPVRVKVEREGHSLEREVGTYLVNVQGHERRAMGVQIRTELELQELPLNIDIQAGNVSGASAGLLFALGIIDRLGPNDLSRGRIVAGTGTIDAGGHVGAIVGAGLKVVAAQRAGATVSLCPEENVPEALAAHTPLQVIPVGTLRQAVEKLTVEQR